MHNFKVSNNDFSVKSTTHSFKLVLCGPTYVKKAELPDIPMYYLNILHLDSIVEGKFQYNVFVDIHGGVTEISQTQMNVDNSKSKIVFSITDNRPEVQCTLWGQLPIKFHDYYKSHKEDGNIVVLLINARIKEAQGGFPLNTSNAWNNTKLLINDVTIDEVSKLRDGCLGTTCVTVATLDKFEAGQSGWYYDGCVDCTKSASLHDGKLVCYSKHISPEPVPRYKLKVLAVDGKYKATFIFWDGDCIKLIGKSALQMKDELIEVGEDDPLEFPFALDAILKQELAIKLLPTEPSSQDEPISFTHEPLSASADYDHAVGNSSRTPSKRTLPNDVEDIKSVQLSSTKLVKDIKK
ncbi:unnamed protein product [Vicia faba]|uniref:Uncharacterized protein n=1 Tax=Vicia faba TaxID=3906 RepID=A0AAV0YWK7_VICFA|nr:unnamed protein product [Vicia faba]